MFFFVDLTPPYCPYFAGQYRGDNFRCLEFYSVGLVGNGADPRVGYAPWTVDPFMSKMHADLAAAIREIDAHISSTDNPVDEETLIFWLVSLAASVLEIFLRIHPFANGNGHMGRALVWVLFARYGIFPLSWPLDMRPPYDTALSEYRDGNRDPLLALIYQGVMTPNLAAR